MGSISGWFWLRQHSYEAQLPSRIMGMTVSCYESPLLLSSNHRLSSRLRSYPPAAGCSTVTSFAGLRTETSGASSVDDGAETGEGGERV